MYLLIKFKIMKKIKNLILGVIGSTLLITGIYSCGNDEINNLEQQNINQTNLQSKPASTSDEGYTYALSFYSGSISLGKSVDIIDPATSQGITITEITVYGDSRARGYIVNKLENNDFLYFVDVNRSTDVLTTYEKITHKTLIFNNLTTSPDYRLTDKFDFIKFSTEYMTYGSGCGFLKKLWGRCEWHRTDPIPGSPGYCMDKILVREYRLGFEMPPRTGGGTGGWAPNSGAYPCN